MGYYIEVPRPKYKAQQIDALYDATILDSQPATFDEVPEGQALICVVDNGPFEAAALIHSQGEFDAFATPDDIGPAAEFGTGPGGVATIHLRSEHQAQGNQRPRTWLTMDRDLAHELAGYTG